MPEIPRISPHAPRFERRVRTTGIMIGVPCYGGMMSAATYHGLRDTENECRDLGIPFHVITITNESLVQRARNRIAAYFLRSSCDRLVFVDADIGFVGAQVLRLVKHDVPLIGATYRKKSVHEVEFAVNFAPHDGIVQRNAETGAVEARHIPTGFMCVKREVFETIRTAMPHLRYMVRDDGEQRDEWAFFDCWIDPASNTYLSEDYAFCERWRALGGTVWLDPAIILEHHGIVPLHADPLEQLFEQQP